MVSADVMGSSEVSDSFESLLAAAGEEAIHLYQQMAHVKKHDDCDIDIRFPVPGSGPS